MVLFPNCKINLGLQILRRRDDGYHDLQTAFYPIGLKDALEVVHQQYFSDEPAVPGPLQKAAASIPVTVSLSGTPIAGDPFDNLCVKAYHLLKKDFPQLPAIALYLYKKIPSGAGLGGGSADGAFMLRLLNEQFQLGISTEKLLDYALLLGSDCPFFILNKSCIAGGRGELLTPVECDLSAYSLLLVHPGIHINTGWAFSQITPAQPTVSLETIITQPIETWKTVLVNDFEAAVFRAHPALGDIKKKLYAAGAIYASMSGSGSCFYGIFPKDDIPAIDWPGNYQLFSV